MDFEMARHLEDASTQINHVKGYASRTFFLQVTAMKALPSIAGSITCRQGIIYVNRAIWSKPKCNTSCQTMDTCIPNTQKTKDRLGTGNFSDIEPPTR